MISSRLVLLIVAAAEAGGPSLIPIIVSGVAAAAAITSGYLAYRASTKANVTSDRKVDLEEHRDAIDRLKRIIDEQDRHQERQQERYRAQLDQMSRQLDSVQSQLTREQDVGHLLRSQLATLQDQVRVLQRMLNEGDIRRPVTGWDDDHPPAGAQLP